MRARGLMVSAVLLAALAGLLIWSNKETAKKAAEPAEGSPPKIIAVSDADVQKIDIKKKDGDHTSVEKTGGKWEMTVPKAYTVDQDTATSLASSAAAVTSDTLVEDKATDLKQFGLDDPALEVDVTQKNGVTHKLLIGDDVPGGMGVYAKLAADPRIFTLASYVKTGLDKSTNDLRDKHLMTFNQNMVTGVDLMSKNQDIQFAHSKDNWQIVKPKPLRADSTQVEDLLNQLKQASMDLSGSEEDAKKAAADYASGAPVATVKVTDNTGTQELQVRKTGADYYAKSSAVDGVYKVMMSLATAVDKPLGDFRTKKLFDFAFNEPNKIEIHANGKTYSFQKSGAKWTSGGKEMDNTSVESLTDQLRDLSAGDFADTGFTTPSIDITVASNDGKLVERVLISKAADKYFAKRENEPAQYQLDSKTVDDLLKAANDVKPAQAAKKK